MMIGPILGATQFLINHILFNQGS